MNRFFITVTSIKQLLVPKKSWQYQLTCYARMYTTSLISQNTSTICFRLVIPIKQVVLQWSNYSKLKLLNAVLEIKQQSCIFE